MPVSNEACRSAAVAFTRHLASRAYAEAYAMTSQDYRAVTTLERMQRDFVAFVPLDWGDSEPIEAVHTMDSWPDKRASDLLWVYVSIGGDVYSEGLTAVLTAEDGQPRIRTVEFGRP